LERDFERSSDREINKFLSVNCWGVQGDLGLSVSPASLSQTRDKSHETVKRMGYARFGEGL
jgi:hypothetical protein